MAVVSIAFVDDHPVLLGGLAHIFSDMPGFKVLGTGRCASDIVEVSATMHPDILLLDLNMPGDVLRRSITAAKSRLKPRSSSSPPPPPSIMR